MSEFVQVSREGAVLRVTLARAEKKNALTSAMYEDLMTDLRPDLAKIQTPTTLLYAYDAGAQSHASLNTDADGNKHY